MNESFVWIKDNEKLEQLGRFFSSAKLMDQEEFQIWKILKTAMQGMNKLTAELDENGRSCMTHDQKINDVVMNNQDLSAIVQWLYLNDGGYKNKIEWRKALVKEMERLIRLDMPVVDLEKDEGVYTGVCTHIGGTGRCSKCISRL